MRGNGKEDTGRGKVSLIRGSGRTVASGRCVPPGDRDRYGRPVGNVVCQRVPTVSLSRINKYDVPASCWSSMMRTWTVDPAFISDDDDRIDSRHRRVGRFFRILRHMHRRSREGRTGLRDAILLSAWTTVTRTVRVIVIHRAQTTECVHVTGFHRRVNAGSYRVLRRRYVMRTIRS